MKKNNSRESESFSSFFYCQSSFNKTIYIYFSAFVIRNMYSKRKSSYKKLVIIFVLFIVEKLSAIRYKILLTDFHCTMVWYFNGGCCWCCGKFFRNFFFGFQEFLIYSVEVWWFFFRSFKESIYQNFNLMFSNFPFLLCFLFYF